MELPVLSELTLHGPFKSVQPTNVQPSILLPSLRKMHIHHFGYLPTNFLNQIAHAAPRLTHLRVPQRSFSTYEIQVALGLLQPAVSAPEVAELPSSLEELVVELDPLPTCLDSWASKIRGEQFLRKFQKIAKTDKRPTYTRGGKTWPVVSTAANAELRSLLLSEEDSIAEATVELQLRVWKKAEAAALAKVQGTGLGQLLGIDFDNIPFQGQLGEHVEADVDAITEATGSLNKDLWTWEHLPYVLRCAGLVRGNSGEEHTDTSERPAKKSKVQGRDELVPDLDEWIIRNENFLRALCRRSDPAPDAWKFGLVRMSQLSAVFGAASAPVSDTNGVTVALKIHRCLLSSLPGYTVLDAKRAENIFVQPSNEAFKRRCDSMTNGLLSGLNWDNVFVAGGIVLGAILTPEVPDANKPDEWLSSDIDMYIHGLSPTLANEKINHIAATYQQNLPPGSPFLVVRNSQTITLYSEWPRRRVQIVLKLVKSPREVLLNFDLDICGCGWDGTEVYLLPRCARSLETATNTFVMDLINGHYLGDRKFYRVFKYANKGYGLRILPSYISSLATYNSPAHRSAIARGEVLADTVSLSELASQARTWTSEVIQEYLEVGHDNRPFHWPSWKYSPIKSAKPVFSHAMLESYAQVTSEPLGRSCLTGFSLFMRHVALWEQEVEGKIAIFEDLWATDTYGEGARVEVAYDDSPAYKWDRTFNLAQFKEALDAHNKQESSVAAENAEMWAYHGDPLQIPPIPAARITYGDSVDEVLTPKHDIVIPLRLEKSFMEFANTEIVAALQDAKQRVGLDENDCAPPLTSINNVDSHRNEEEVLALWRLNKILNWQMLDRRIDEIREVLWAFHRANERMIVEDESRHKFLMTNISKRAIRTTVEDEQEAFVRWVTRQPYHEETKFNAIYHYEEGGY
ncbi:hypothetical protein FB451DRAFT_1335825 [Mycena latifolia]|nr:hypothetical protein FB451DRAFT_1335825 [Mycena latifolia]